MSILNNVAGSIGSILGGAGAGYVNPNSGAGLSNNGYVLQTNNTGTTWAKQPTESALSVIDKDGKRHNVATVASEVEFLVWFIESYYPDARKEFEAVKDIERKANETT